MLKGWNRQNTNHQKVWEACIFMLRRIAVWIKTYISGYVSSAVCKWLMSEVTQDSLCQVGACVNGVLTQQNASSGATGRAQAWLATKPVRLRRLCFFFSLAFSLLSPPHLGRQAGAALHCHAGHNSWQYCVSFVEGG